MKRNGMHALDFHGPALVERRLTYLHGQQFMGRVVTLCFLPYNEGLSALAIDRHTIRFHEAGVALVLVCSGGHPLHRWWVDPSDTPRTTMLADPGRRLHRSFGVTFTQASLSCRTFVIDRRGILRLCVSHEFVDGDLDALRKIVASTQRHPSNSAAMKESAKDTLAPYVRS